MVNENDLSRREFVDGLESLRKDIRSELDEFKRSLDCTKGRAAPTGQRAASELPCNELRREISELRQSTTSSKQKDAVSKAVVVLLLILATLAGWLYPNVFPSKDIQNLVATLNKDIKLPNTPSNVNPQTTNVQPANPLPQPNYPTWREEKYTVLKPVYETVMKDEKYTVRKPIQETSYTEEKYTERRPVTETVMHEEKIKVRRPVYETQQREQRVTVRKPVYETTYRQQHTTVKQPVTNWVSVCQMHNYQPVWTNVPVTSLVPQTVVQNVPVQTVRYVDAVDVRKVPVQTVRYVDDEHVRKVPVETTRHVEEERASIGDTHILACNLLTEIRRNY